MLVRSTPVMLTHLTPERLVRDLAEHVHTQPIPPSRDAMVAELLHMVACKAAVKAGDRLSPEEIEALLERGTSSPTPITVPTAGPRHWCSPRRSWRSSSAEFEANFDF